MKLKHEILIAVGIFLVLGLAYYYWVVIPEDNLEKSHLYTVATITGHDTQDNGPELARFCYSYKGQNFCSSFGMDYTNQFKVGSRIYVMFSPSDPEYVKVILDRLVPESLKTTSDGWKTIP